MSEGPEIAALAALIGDPARARMLEALMSGAALTAGELAKEAGVSAQTASGHLGRMREAGLLGVEAQGRHRYYRLAGPAVADGVEALMGLAARVGQMRTRPGPKDAAMRFARACYDHIAGELGVRLHDAWIAEAWLAASADGLKLTSPGRRQFEAFGFDVAALEHGRRPVCRACLDWSERRPHLAGALGAAVLRRAYGQGWARRDAKGRALHFSRRGLASFEALLLPAAVRETDLVEAQET